ncbi:BCS1-like ATPase-like protein [Zopfia rhizophila CBS 207.26]|uniref:BCS1-like ATPase-like protein n=1 Tax=Zopfia rhizophila CBS 207.26 TaxID=1314779 RepID=A0A6A6DN56_9PEZI|nr:BCS1-like ATPase-like protein [Zopfia rhizophila CBS 207.26]
MDFARLQSIKFDAVSNSTLTTLPSTILEAFIPGYSIISQLIFKIFGFDIGLVVFGGFIIVGLVNAIQYLYYKAYGVFSSYFMSSCTVEDDDDLYSQIMEWIAEQPMIKNSRDVKAVTRWVSAYSDDEDADDNDEDILDETGIFNFEKWASNIPPRYEPNFGSDKFWHEGRLFFFSRERREKQARSPWGDREEEILHISCVGRSTEPIKELLNHIKRWSLSKENKMTCISRPAPKEERKDYAWDRVTSRPSRPMSTVSLDQEQKANIVADINEYLHPASARWYAARGIPYRRGYLFHGPPGTGKTSLSFSIAGIFGLDVYCISLVEVGLTESDLNKLFSHLPRRCVVLLEDIDSAGLRRVEDTTEGSKEEDDSSTDDDSLTKVSKPDSTPKSQGQPTNGFKSLISLSGLLNVIDGVASHEGRVLIMTTNHPEKLDAALIRPGRVDLQVQFSLATKDQIRDIFYRMYSTEYDKKKDRSVAPKSSNGKATATTPTSDDAKSSSKEKGPDGEFYELLQREPVLDIVEPGKLREMAEEFASQLPEGKLSPAEIQGFLLMRKKEPSRALKEVGKWRDSLMEAKEKGEKVLDVQ